MTFNDTTTYDGLVQHYEKWTRQARATVSGSTDLLKDFASQVNSYAFPKLIPMLLAFNDQIRWDDTNNTDAPVGYINLVSGQNDYKITQDANSYDILNITKVRVHNSATDTVYHDLTRVTSDDPSVPEIIDPSQNVTSVPTAFVELGNTLYLNVKPSYNSTSGLEIFFGRQQQYFAYTDTTKKPGIPLPFHILLALYPALQWTMINRTDDSNLLTLLRGEIAERMKECETFIALRNPTRAKMTGKKILYI